MKLKELEDIIEKKIIAESRKGALSGKKYEVKIANTIDSALKKYWKTPQATKAGHFPTDYDIRAAGFGAASDIVLICNGKTILSLEAKTQAGAEFGQAQVRFNVKDYVWELSNPNPDLIEMAMAEAAFSNLSWAENIITFEPWELWYYQSVLQWQGPEIQLKSLTIPKKGKDPFAEKALSRLADEDRNKTIRLNKKNARCLRLPGTYISGLKKGTMEYCKLPCPDMLAPTSQVKICDMREELKFELEKFWGLTKSAGEGWSGNTPIPWDFISNRYKEKGDMFIQVGKGKGLFALDDPYTTWGNKTPIPLWQDQDAKAKVRFRLKRQSGTLDPLTFKFALGISNLKSSPIDLEKPNTQEFNNFIITLAEKIKNSCGKEEESSNEITESLTNTKTTYKMLEQMVEEAIKKAR